MADIFSPTERSRLMARIRSHGNQRTELALIRVLRAHHLKGWRRHRPVFGRPDFVFPQRRVAVFVDGCFWHACPRHATQPQHNAEFWRRKLAVNRARDRLVNRTLRRAGWRVVRFWEHDLTRRGERRIVARLQAALRTPA